VQLQHIKLQSVCCDNGMPCPQHAASAPDELLDPEHGALYAWLRVGVVVLDALQQLAQAPVAVSLHVKHDALRIV
jgi:hypothetical protein